MATASEIGEIIKLYVGYYNRAPDPVGLNFWIDAFDNGFDLDAMAEDFSTQPETLGNYPFFENPTPSDADYGSFIDSVYQNLFNRDPDAAGRAFWVEKLGSGEFSVGQAISLIIEGATTSPDQDVVANKVAVGRDFYTDTNALPPYIFDADDIAAATAIQASVTENPASVAAAAVQTDAYVAAISAGPGRTINLTLDADNPGGGGMGVDTQGGSGDDTYAGTVQQGGTGTLSNADSIAAGGGVDTLDVRLVTGNTGNLGDVITLNASDLENITVTNQILGATQFLMDLNAVSGEQLLTAVGGNQNAATVFGNVDEGTAIRMVDVKGAVGVDFKGNQTAGSSDSFSLAVENVGTADRSAIFLLTEDGFAGQEEGFEIATLDVGGNGASFLDLNGLALDRITVTGSRELHLEDGQDAFEELEVLDASAMTGGGIALDAQGSTEAGLRFTGSGFDDTLALSNDLLGSSTSLSLDAGAGNDTLSVETFTSNAVGSVNRADGFEVLESRSHSTTLDASAYDDIDSFVLNQSANGSRLNIFGVTTEDTFVFVSDAGRTDEFIRFEADTVGQSLTFEMRAEAEDGGQIEFVAAGNNNSSAAIGFTGNSDFSDVTIHSTGVNEDANLIRAIDGGNGNHFAFDNSDGPTNFLVTGGQALTITAAEGVDLTSSDKESGFSENVNLDASGATGDLRIAASNANDRIEGGSGDDILYGMGGDDILIGNDGADQFRFSNWSGTDEILDFTSGEDLVGLWRTDFQNTTASTEGAVLNSADYVENIQTIANITNAEESKLVELQSAASQTQIEDTQISSGTEAYVLVFNATSGKGELWWDDDWSTAGSRQHTATFDDVTSLADLVGFSNTDFAEYLF